MYTHTSSMRAYLRIHMFDSSIFDIVSSELPFVSSMKSFIS